MKLSSRAKAFSVENLLHLPKIPAQIDAALCDREDKVSCCDECANLDNNNDNNNNINDNNSDNNNNCNNSIPINEVFAFTERERQRQPLQAPAAQELHLKGGEGELVCEDNVDRAGGPAENVPDTPHQPPEMVSSCFCHGEMSLCMHLGVINVRDHSGDGNVITVELLHSDLWSSFHRLGTEMIITKSGRRMFPSLKLRINGLDATKIYETRLEFLQPDSKKYRYIYHTWMISGSGDSLMSTPCHSSPESPLAGQAICSQVLSFERLKLTNADNRKQGQVSLVSMQKFQPRIVIEEMGSDKIPHRSNECYHIVFPQTSFMAVTAYQNQQITTLKIASNPFAKGFRDSGKLRYPYEANMANSLTSLHAPAHIRFGYNMAQMFQPPGDNCLLMEHGVDRRIERKRHQPSLDVIEHHRSKRIGGETSHVYSTSPPLPFVIPQQLGGFSPHSLPPGLTAASPSSTPSLPLPLQQQHVFCHNLSTLRPVLTPRENYDSSMHTLFPSPSTFPLLHFRQNHNFSQMVFDSCQRIPSQKSHHDQNSKRSSNSASPPPPPLSKYATKPSPHSVQTDEENCVEESERDKEIKDDKNSIPINMEHTVFIKSEAGTETEYQTENYRSVSMTDDFNSNSDSNKTPSIPREPRRTSTTSACASAGFKTPSVNEPNKTCAPSNNPAFLQPSLLNLTQRSKVVPYFYHRHPLDVHHGQYTTHILHDYQVI